VTSAYETERAYTIHLDDVMLTCQVFLPDLSTLAVHGQFLEWTDQFIDLWLAGEAECCEVSPSVANAMHYAAAFPINSDLPLRFHLHTAAV
jgi:hypothetical protein